MFRSARLCRNLSRPATLASRANFVPPQSLVRQTSTASSGEPSTGRASPQWQRRARSLLCAGIFVTIGLTYGFDLRKKMSQPPIPGSAEDKLDMNEIRATYELLPVVAELRANPDFAELEPDDREEASEEEKGRYLQAGPMAGSRGLAIRRTFWNEKEKLAASIVFFGPGLEGWPSFVHGGAISVVLDERLGRVALRIFPERDGVTANLNIDYRAPVISGNFYTVYAKYDAEKSTERKAYVDGTILDIAGNLCAEATGLFVVPKNFKPSQLNKHGSA